MVPGIKLTLRKQPMNEQINIYISAPLIGAAGFQSQTVSAKPRAGVCSSHSAQELLRETLVSTQAVDIPRA